MTETTHKIELPDGYTDSQGTRHTSLTFARRVTGADLFDLEARRAARSRGDLVEQGT